jgi:RNA polymerase-binding transcription factor DksA
MTIGTPANRQPATPSLPLAELAAIRETLRADRRIHLDRLARLDEAATESFDDQAATSALRTLLLEIDAALQRIDHGGYGACETCTRPIPAARLHALPHSTRCVSCA